VSTKLKTVISASRRTDIPAFYMDWFMAGIDRGSFDVVNPYNRRARHVLATPDSVHTIVFWSKNFDVFIKGRYGEQLAKKGYHLFFNFTINSESAVLEPHVPPLTERLYQLSTICDIFDVKAVNWRFDPICFYKTNGHEVHNNLDDFLQIADKASELGVRRCITSFVDLYPKINRRMQKRPGFSFVDIAMDEKIKILNRMVRVVNQRNIDLQTCCEKKVLESLPCGMHVTHSACIPNDLIMDIYGGSLSLKRDAGQRTKAGCGCKESIDIGSYDLHPCYHNCLFCYANPSASEKHME
jgi:hypothetical protein